MSDVEAGQEQDSPELVLIKKIAPVLIDCCNNMLDEAIRCDSSKFEDIAKFEDITNIVIITAAEGIIKLVREHDASQRRRKRRGGLHD